MILDPYSGSLARILPYTSDRRSRIVGYNEAMPLIVSVMRRVLPAAYIISRGDGIENGIAREYAITS